MEGQAVASRKPCKRESHERTTDPEPGRLLNISNVSAVQ